METPRPSTPIASPRINIKTLVDTLSLDDDPSTPRVGGRRLGEGYGTLTHGTPSHFFPSSSRRNPGDFPPEIVSLIVHHLYDILLPPLCAHPSPDPPSLHLLPRQTAYGSPLFAPTPLESARECFANLALVDRTWGAAAMNALWRTVGFGMPRAFESVLRTAEEYKKGVRGSRRDVSSGWSIGTMAEAGRQTSSLWGEDGKWSRMAGDARDGSMGPSSVQMGEVSACESRASTGAGTAADVTPWTAPSQALAAPFLDPSHSPLLLTKVISFARFRTAGLRRSVSQGSHERFVTPHRLLSLLRGTRLGDGPLMYPGAGEHEEESVVHDQDDWEDDEHRTEGKLEAVGFTEFMDSAISKDVLDELLFRGGYLAEYLEEEVSHYERGSGGEDDPLDYHPHHLRSPLWPARPLLPERKSAETVFLARHLQSSHSRSPSSRPHRPTLSSAMEETTPASSDYEDNINSEYDEHPMDLDSNEEDEHRGRAMSSTSSNQLVFVNNHPHHPQRRTSGAAYAPRPQPGAPTSQRDSSEDRGRDRVGRHTETMLPAPGRARRSRSLLPPSSSFSNRSSSVPAHHLLRSSSVDASERSSSVPASVRRSRTTKIVRVLEGSTQVRAIRALDLCGCISGAFVAALAEAVGKYRLGPEGSIEAIGGIAPIEEDYDTDDEAMTESGQSSIWSEHETGDGGTGRRKLKRIFFPHLRRLGLASALLPHSLLTAFVLSFPFLTHLDLTSTLATPLLIKHLALAGQNGPGGRSMRLKSLNLSRCRLLTGEAILGLLCGDCPPFTSMNGMGRDGEGEASWGSGEIVSQLVDLSLFGDSTHPSPLAHAELKLILTISPAFNSGYLRSLDLSSTPLTDALLMDSFPAQPHLIQLGLANCRFITIRGVAAFLLSKAPSVEILDLSNSCPPAVVVPVNAARRTGINNGAPGLSIMELHQVLLARVASVNPSSGVEWEARHATGMRGTNLRVVELDGKSLEGVQGGAGDWKAIWGKGRRGWYVPHPPSYIPYCILTTRKQVRRYWSNFHPEPRLPPARPPTSYPLSPPPHLLEAYGSTAPARFERSSIGRRRMAR
jgi:hypothetical protein